MPVKNVEETALFAMGENMTISLMLKAIIATHPNPTELLRVSTESHNRASKALSEKPSPNIQLFRYEQLLEELLSCIPNHPLQ